MGRLGTALDEARLELRAATEEAHEARRHWDNLRAQRPALRLEQPCSHLGPLIRQWEDKVEEAWKDVRKAEGRYNRALRAVTDNTLKEAGCGEFIGEENG